MAPIQMCHKNRDECLVFPIWDQSDRLMYGRPKGWEWCVDLWDSWDEFLPKLTRPTWRKAKGRALSGTEELDFIAVTCDLVLDAIQLGWLLPNGRTIPSVKQYLRKVPQSFITTGKRYVEEVGDGGLHPELVAKASTEDAFTEMEKQSLREMFDGNINNADTKSPMLDSDDTPLMITAKDLIEVYNITTKNLSSLAEDDDVIKIRDQLGIYLTDPKDLPIYSGSRIMVDGISDEDILKRVDGHSDGDIDAINHLKELINEPALGARPELQFKLVDRLRRHMDIADEGYKKAAQLKEKSRIAIMEKNNELEEKRFSLAHSWNISENWTHPETYLNSTLLEMQQGIAPASTILDNLDPEKVITRGTFARVGRFATAATTGFVAFNYNLGTTKVLINSIKNLQPERLWHSVSIKNEMKRRQQEIAHTFQQTLDLLQLTPESTWGTAKSPRRSTSSATLPPGRNARCH